MTTLKVISAALIASATLSSCFLGTSNQERSSHENFVNEYQNSNPPNESRAGGVDDTNKERKTPRIAQNQIKNFPIHDAKTGLVSSTVPFPGDWIRVENSREYTFEGPNKLKVSGTFGKHFPYGNPYGGQNTPPMSINQIVSQFFMPTAKQTNRKLIAKYELPEAANVMSNYLGQLWKYAPSNDTTKAYGLEWQDNNNMKYITVLFVTNSQSQLGSYWSFMGQYLQAQSQDFEQAKKAYIYGLENTQYNPRYIAAHNQNEMQRAGVRNAAHQSRMAALNNQAAAQRKLGRTYSDISDISHDGYMKRSGVNDAGHAKSVDAVYGNTTVFNPNQSGQTYKVESYNNYYYGNGQGEVISTDNSLYNPNRDKTVNNQEWTRYEIDN